MTINRQLAKALLIVFIVTFTGIFFNVNELNQYPKYIHTWTQIDRYALALKFTDNNLNFFKPETFVYNHIYPGNMRVPHDTTITAVDFPLHDYIPAVIMKALGERSPVFFRVYILLYSLLGIFFLYKLSFLWTNNFFKSLFVTLLAVTSPIFIYYQGGFLPTIPSLANSIIGIYFYSLYIIHNNRNSSFNLALLFMTLAGLSRTTFLIPLIAMLGIELIRIVRKESAFKVKVIPVIISLSLIIGYWFYNRYLRLNYGSMFLAEFLPAKDMEEAERILSVVSDKWLTHYFTWLHYIIFGGIVLLLINLSICGRIGKWNKHSGVFGFFLLTTFIGVFLFTGLMLKQFEAHDYYFLDSFFLPILLLIILILQFFPLPDTRKSRIVLSVVLATSAILLFMVSSAKVKERRLTGSWDLHTNTINNYIDSQEFLQDLKVPANAKMMVLDATSPNGALTLMNRNGYPVKYLTQEKVVDALTWDFDYIVFENANFMKIVYPVYPDIVRRLNKIGDNGKISVCTLSDTLLNQTAEDLFSLENFTPVWSELITFDSEISENWKNISVTSQKSFSGKKSSMLTNNQTFGIAFDTEDLPELTEKERSLIVSGRYMRMENIEKCYVVVSMTLDDIPNAFYVFQDLKDFIPEKKLWQKASIRFELPKVTANKYKFSVYIWNLGKNDLLIDDMELKLY